LAWLLAVIVFSLICMGGTVTTYESGMAVRDWPTTFDYWFYPIKLWLAVWDVFLEHGHRLLGQLAGIVATVLAVAIWRQDQRKWMRWVAVAVVAGVVAQGTLGGLRVLADDRVLARIHGCIAPLYFGLCAAVVTWTSRRWQGHFHGSPPSEALARSASEGMESMPSLARRASVISATVASNVRLQRLAWLLLAVIYLEIVFGAILRRPSVDTTPGDVGLWVWLKLITAGLIVLSAGWLLAGVLRHLRGEPTLVRRGLWLAGALTAQLALAAATWVTNYGWPEWFTRWIWPLGYTVVAQGRLQVFATTAHAAAGSLLLAVSLSLALRLQCTPHAPREEAASRGGR
jgi:cytochrome c oxidase assembly protein subunit 15